MPGVKRSFSRLWGFGHSRRVSTTVGARYQPYDGVNLNLTCSNSCAYSRWSVPTVPYQYDAAPCRIWPQRRHFGRRRGIAGRKRAKKIPRLGHPCHDDGKRAISAKKWSRRGSRVPARPFFLLGAFWAKIVLPARGTVEMHVVSRKVPYKIAVVTKCPIMLRVVRGISSPDSGCASLRHHKHVSPGHPHHCDHPPGARGGPEMTRNRLKKNAPRLKSIRETPT